MEPAQYIVDSSTNTTAWITDTKTPSMRMGRGAKKAPASMKSTLSRTSLAKILPTCTRHLVADQAEGTFERLRYLLGGNRPS